MPPDLPLTAQAEAALARWGIRLAFPPALEARYRLDQAAERAREQRMFFRIGLVLYIGIGAAMKLAGVTSISWHGFLLQMSTTALAGLLMIHYCFRPHVPDNAREGAALACCLIASLAAILVTFSKPAGLQDLIIAALPANFVLMFMRLRFSFAAVFALLTCLCYVACILLRPALPASEQAFLVTFITILCLPALVGVHALEKASRRVYLHGFLQRQQLSHMAAENVTLTELSMTDPLTLTANRRRFDEALNRFCAANSRGGALLLIDVDRFKSFNDRHGHPAGDVCLQLVAKCLAAHLRRRDLLARFGGEEFAVLLNDVTAQEAAIMAERLRLAVETCPITIGTVRRGVTVSIGIAVRTADKTPKTLIEAADIALYAAKAAGRNQVRTPAA